MYLYTDVILLFLFFFKQKPAYEMRISDWSSDVCSSDLRRGQRQALAATPAQIGIAAGDPHRLGDILSRIVEKSAHRRDDRAVELIEGWRVTGITDRSANRDDRPGRPAEVGEVPGLPLTGLQGQRTCAVLTSRVAQPPATASLFAQTPP